MRLSDFPSTTLRRFQRPVTWGALLGFGLVWVLVRWAGGQPFQQIGLDEFMVPVLALAGHLALSAAPWQWTGDSRPMAPLLRGSLQALPWNALWLMGLLAFIHGAFPPSTRPRALQPPPPRLARRAWPPLRPPAPRPRPAPRPEFMLFLLNLPFAMVLGWFLAERERMAALQGVLETRVRDARAVALQAQLHPHALYNVLSGLTELVHEDPDAAEEALLALVDLLRLLTRHGAATLCPLSEERLLLKHYLAIESIRLGSRLQVAWVWPVWADALELPPLLLQPLVENAVKHGISSHPEGGQLRIEAHGTPYAFQLRVANTGSPFQPGDEGTGLRNLRERLALLSSLQGSLRLAREGDWTLADLMLRPTLKA
jgi:hypothetical protein